MRFIFLISFFLFSCQSRSIKSLTFIEQKSGNQSSLRGISVVNDTVVWISGSAGIVGRTIDAGVTWKSDSIPNARRLQFRDIEAFSAKTAIIMSAGPGKLSRIYKTENAGESWDLKFMNEDSNAFFNAIEFWDEKNGICISDPINGKPYLLKTADAGETWTQIDPDKLPAMKEKEYGFAASGTNMIVYGKSHLWIGTGGSVARVFRSEDRGESWSVTNTEMMQALPSAGIFSLAFRNENFGIAVGGDYSNRDSVQVNSLVSVNSGKDWQVYRQHQTSGYRSCVRYIPHSLSAIAIGRDGADYSNSDGKNWTPIKLKKGYYSLSVSPSGTYAWASGSDGRVAKILIEFN